MLCLLILKRNLGIFVSQPWFLFVFCNFQRIRGGMSDNSNYELWFFGDSNQFIFSPIDSNLDLLFDALNVFLQFLPIAPLVLEVGPLQLEVVSWKPIKARPVVGTCRTGTGEPIRCLEKSSGFWIGRKNQLDKKLSLTMPTYIWCQPCLPWGTFACHSSPCCSTQHHRNHATPRQL